MKVRNMSNEQKIKALAEVINGMAKTLTLYARELNKVSENLLKTGDLYYSVEALQKAQACFSSLRLELLLTNVLRDNDGQ